MTRHRYFRPPRFFRFMRATVLLAFSGLALLGAAQQSPKADAITGRVTDGDGNPLVNARVSANKAGARGPDRIYRGTTTGDEGYFRLAGLPPGDYYISASAEGYLHGYAFATEHSAQDNRYFRPGASVTITLKKGGVITGRVTDAEDRAVVAVPVSLEYVREADDRPRTVTYVGSEEWTDDRGVYRFYSLQPGSYLVRAGGRGPQDRGASAFDTDAPTYYPSATRENATQVRVGAGEEATGIDIHYRGERGHAIRGVVAGAAELNRRPYVKLNRPPGAQVGFTDSRVEDQSLKFDFEGLPDGEYELIAGRSVSDEDDGGASAPRRVTINGDDVNGIELRLIPFASLSGRFIHAADSTDCQIQQRRGLIDVSLVLHRDGAAQAESAQDRPNQQGEFAIRGLEAGRYQLVARLPHTEWYLRAITQPSPASANRPVDVSRQGFTLRPGERKTGLIMTVAEGAALLVGRVIPAEGAQLPTRLSVHLVPAEPASAEDALRYAETVVRSDGSFGMSHLAPGRYWLLARAASDAEAPPAAWSAENRAKLRREARASKVEIELQACQRVTDYVLRY